MYDLLLHSNDFFKDIFLSLNIFSIFDFLFKNDSILLAIAIIVVIIVAVCCIIFPPNEHSDKSSEQKEDNACNSSQSLENKVSTEAENEQNFEQIPTLETVQTPSRKRITLDSEPQSGRTFPNITEVVLGDFTTDVKDSRSVPKNNSIPSVQSSSILESGSKRVTISSDEESSSRTPSEAEKAEFNYYIQQLQALLQNQFKDKIQVLEERVSSISKDYNAQVQANERLIKQIGLFVDSIQQVLESDCDENYKKAYSNNLKTFLRLFSKAGIQKIEPQEGEPFDEETMLPIKTIPCQLTPECITEGYKEGARIVVNCHGIGLAYNGHVLEIGGNKRVAVVEIVEFVKE